MSMTGRQIKERLERDLGFEANRARLLAESAASAEVSIYWERKGLGKINEKAAALAKAALVSGLTGRQKLAELVFNVAAENPKNVDLSEVVTELSALVLDHQKTLNLSRNRATCVNAHLNVLEPERSLPQIYSAFLTGEEIKNAVSKANTLLKREVSSASDFTKWARDVHELLSSVSNGEQEEESEDDFSDSSTKKGLISRRAISTYLKQWELFAKEKLGPTFSIEVKENEASPLTNKLNRLESGASRTWTTMLENITEVRTSTVFQKRATVSAERGTITSSTKNLDSYDFDLKGRPLKIQLSPEVGAVTITQFVKAMKAQFLAYSGMGLFTVSLQSGKSVVTVSLPAAVKADLKKIEEFLLELI